MPKPRTWKTGFKHFGTIVAHPQQYYRYKKHRDAFVAENHLPLNDHYQGELAAPVHPYPDAVGATIREQGVIYPGADHAQTVVQGRLTAQAPFDHQLARGVDQAQLGRDRSTLVVLQTEANGAGPVLRAAKKRDAHADVNFPDIGRTQHSTLGGGQPVASAALLHNGQVKMSSGHYRPDDAAAVKLAIHGKQTGTLLRRETDFTAHDNPVDLSMKRRMQMVANWARNR